MGADLGPVQKQWGRSGEGEKYTRGERAYKMDLARLDAERRR